MHLGHGQDSDAVEYTFINSTYTCSCWAAVGQLARLALLASVHWRLAPCASPLLASETQNPVEFYELTAGFGSPRTYCWVRDSAYSMNLRGFTQASSNARGYSS